MMQKNISSIILSILISFISFCDNPLVARGAGRPLFIQVHITNPLSDISSEAAKRICSGKAARFSDIGGENRPMRIFVESGIAGEIKKSYPALQCGARPFTDRRLMADRSFMGISDVRGLTPCFKILSIDGLLPWGKKLEDGSIVKGGPYPLTMKDAEAWDPDSHITIVHTATTAMTRGFIRAVDSSGDTLSPIRHTRNITSRADLAVTSNEVSFVDPCTYPLRDSMVFCSPTRFFAILKESGFNVIELTGNHNNDFGSRYNAETIGMLELNGMHHFGGGRNRSDAEKPLYVRIKGKTIAFVGFNECGPESAWATETRPGAARLSQPLYAGSIKEARKKADIVIVTVQWCNENDPVPQQIQKKYFHLAADLGADIMVSSSAHRPMGLEIYRGRFISYGLGNFLFDQMQSLNTRRGLIARHHIYAGRHITTEIIPYLIHDYSQPRILTGREARDCMREVFSRSIGEAFR
jgi:poly-gamma-glutamate synthesis protein (capsule biosynthesis protein)